MMQKLKYLNSKIISNLIAKDKVLAESIEQDNNNIHAMILIQFFTQTLKLVIIILNISYFVGIGWYILCDVIRRSKIGHDVNPNQNNSMFLTHFALKNENDECTSTGLDASGKQVPVCEFEERSELYQCIAVMYFAFTSLSTVGFGDYHPRSDEERLLCAFILLFGVAIFSYIMGNFIEMIGTYQELNADLDDGDNLTRFFGLITHFNNKVDIDIKLKTSIEQHFDYKWGYDKNQAIDEESEFAMLE